MINQILPVNKSLIAEEFSKHSSIVKSKQWSQRLVNMFKPQVIKSVKLIFKASENDFKLEEYWAKCGDLTHTMIICETKRHRVIGGYTPAAHQFNPQQNIIDGSTPDPTGTSFLFSLTNDQKFHLRNPQRAIYRFKDHRCIHFGGVFGQLKIVDQSNVNQCISSINYLDFYVLEPKDKSSYYNETYKDNARNQPEQMMRFNGSKTPKFKTKQWQVWKIQFQE